jgi:lipid-A-disaccharide synthase
MIIVYRVSAFTFFLARLLVSVKHIGIVNIIAGSRIVPELVQTEFTASRLVCESQKIITDGETRQQMVDNLLNLRSKLGAPGAADRVAELALAAIA